MSLCYKCLKFHPLHIMDKRSSQNIWQNYPGITLTCLAFLNIHKALTNKQW